MNAGIFHYMVRMKYRSDNMILSGSRSLQGDCIADAFPDA